ncbi:MAG TPA: ABC transporter substrate-binding protein [Actinomycetota bacterium]|nr:ABC transporter substrate-binding protein [Actinomycetota bacterium]
MAAFSALSFVAVQTPGQQQEQISAGDFDFGDQIVPTESAGPLSPTGPAPTGGPTDGPAPTAGPATSKFQCAAGRNGGRTDKGVSANEIKVAATHVQSGLGSSFLGSSNIGMRAVVSSVNSSGGICGRQIRLTLVDDGWDAARGSQYIRNFINDDYFALPVVPSSEGLTAAIRNGTIDRAGIPVIGTDGMLKDQYQSPWVWPVATATVSTMRAMAFHAYNKLGARNFGIVYDNQYKFGVEGATAFRDYVSSLPGAKVSAYVGIQPGQPSYTETTQFNSKCGASKRCDFVAMLLEPGTATSWINSQGVDEQDKKLGFGTKGTGGAQPLFNENFARDCGAPCSGMMLWTGYNPPIGALRNQPGIARYLSQVRAIDPGVDVNNQFLQGAYLGMQVFVKALEDVGAELTRARLRAAMDSMTYATDLASSLTWKAGRHYANTSARAFLVVTASGGFSGFRDAGTGFVPDPKPGVFPKG